MVDPAGENTRTVVLDSGTQQILLRKLLVRVQPPDGAERIVPIAQRSLLIGTGADCDVQLDDPSVSRRHIRIEADRLGYKLTDLGSKNGTWAQNLRLE